MAAFLIVGVTAVHDEQIYAEYRARDPATLYSLKHLEVGHELFATTERRSCLRFHGLSPVIIRLLRDMGYRVREDRIPIDEVVKSHQREELRECFGTGTAATVTTTELGVLGDEGEPSAWAQARRARSEGAWNGDERRDPDCGTERASVLHGNVVLAPNPFQRGFTASAHRWLRRCD